MLTLCTRPYTNFKEYCISFLYRITFEYSREKVTLRAWSSSVDGVQSPRGDCVSVTWDRARKNKDLVRPWATIQA